MNPGTRNEDWRVEAGPVVGRPTALVAAGNRDTRERLTRILDHLGFTVFQARSRAEAGIAADRYPGRLDLLVTSVTLPDGPGARLVRSLARLGIEPAVLYLGSRDEGERERSGVRGSRESVLVEPATRRQVAEQIAFLFDLRGVRIDA